MGKGRPCPEGIELPEALVALVFEFLVIGLSDIAVFAL
jgi:hypothetical protein